MGRFCSPPLCDVVYHTSNANCSLFGPLQLDFRLLMSYNVGWAYSVLVSKVFSFVNVVLTIASLIFSTVVTHLLNMDYCLFGSQRHCLFLQYRLHYFTRINISSYYLQEISIYFDPIFISLSGVLIFPYLYLALLDLSASSTCIR